MRISKKSGSIIEKVKSPAFQRAVRNKNKIDGLKDTPAQKVLEITYMGEDFAKIKKEFDEYIIAKQQREKLLIFKE